jgi:hypothetical protein
LNRELEKTIIFAAFETTDIETVYYAVVPNLVMIPGVRGPGPGNCSNPKDIQTAE